MASIQLVRPGLAPLAVAKRRQIVAAIFSLWWRPHPTFLFSMNHKEFQAMFDFGASGEEIVASWLQSKGVPHFALYPLGLLRHGPRVRMGDGSTLASPDFFCWGAPPHPSDGAVAGAQGDQFFIDVKRFRRWWYAGAVEQTGVEAAKIAEYKRLATTTGKKVYLYFLHLDELMRGEGLFFGNVGSLVETGSTFPDDKELLMFNKADLAQLATDEDLAWHAPSDQEKDKAV